MRIEEFLRHIGATLDSAGVPYMLTGSLASSMYGMPRATNDIDIVIAPDRAGLQSLVKLFEHAGLYVSSEEASAALELRGQFNVIDFGNGWKVDLIVRKDREFSIEEFTRRERIEIEGTTLTVATAEDVVVAKLEWAKLGDSVRQLRDIASILAVQGDDLDVPYIERWIELLDLKEQWAAATRERD